MTKVTVNGNEYSDDGSSARDMRGGGFRQWLLKMISDVMVKVNAIDETAAGFQATSGTSLVVGTGSKTLTTQANKRFTAGTFVTITRTSNSAISMFGKVTAYNASTGVMTVDVISFDSTGTFTDWSIAVSGARGPTGPAGSLAAGSMAGALNLKAGNSLTVSASPDIWSVGGNSCYISGSGTITGYPNAPQAGAGRSWIANGSGIILQCNASHIIYGVAIGATITLADRDMVDVHADDVGLFRVTIRRRGGRAVVADAPVMALLGQATVSGPVANIDFLNLFAAEYDNYVIMCNDLSPSVASSNRLRVQFAAAGAVDTGTNYTASSAATTSALVTSIDGSRFTGRLEVYGANSAGTILQVDGSSRAFSANTVYPAEENTCYSGASAVSGFRLFWSAGANFTAGTVRVYGIRNAVGTL